MAEIFSETERDPRESHERGLFALQLVLAPQEWIHRRVETVSFLQNGETRRRLSWDFTLPTDAVITASAGQVAVPLTLMRKAVMMRLDVHDQAGTSCPVWGRADNGLLARDALEAGLASLQRSEATKAQCAAIQSIVYAPNLLGASHQINELFAGLEEASTEVELDRRLLLRAVAESFAENFLFVVELPDGAVGRRSIVKLNYDGPLGGRARSGPTGRYETTIAGTDWSSAKSWHLEVHAPDGLVVQDLRYETWEPDGLALLEVGSSEGIGATAHVAGGPGNSEAVSEARLTLAPDPTGLVNQSLAAALFSWLVLTIMTLNAQPLADLTADGDRAGALAGVTLALPAIMVAWLARGAEHELVSRLLVLPRLNSALTALGLLLAATALVLGLNAEQLERMLFVLWAVQWLVLS